MEKKLDPGLEKSGLGLGKPGSRSGINIPDPKH